MKDIDANYCCQSTRFNLSEETRLCKTAEDIKPREFSKKFITEIFFMCHFALHTGIIPILTTYDRILQELSRLAQKKKELQAVSNPMNDITLKKIQVCSGRGRY